MGVYIKGLGMPEKCINCKFCVDMNEYPFHACFITDSDIPFDIDKLKNCPLIEIDLVRCGECKWFADDGCGFGLCERPFVDYLRTAEYDFCSYGERRADET